MPTEITLNNTGPVYVPADEDNPQDVHVVGSRAIYGPGGFELDKPEGAVEPGASVTLVEGRYFRTAGQSRLVVAPAAVEPPKLRKKK